MNIRQAVVRQALGAVTCPSGTYYDARYSKCMPSTAFALHGDCGMGAGVVGVPVGAFGRGGGSTFATGSGFGRGGFGPFANNYGYNYSNANTMQGCTDRGGQLIPYNCQGGMCNFKCQDPNGTVYDVTQ